MKQFWYSVYQKLKPYKNVLDKIVNVMWIVLLVSVPIEYFIPSEIYRWLLGVILFVTVPYSLIMESGEIKEKYGLDATIAKYRKDAGTSTATSAGGAFIELLLAYWKPLLIMVLICVAFDRLFF